MAPYPVIVVSDDDATFIELIKELLSDRGYPSVTSVLGDRAYDVIRDLKADLVVLDINIMNSALGWNTLDRLKVDPRTAHIPVIICSTDPRLPEHKADWLRQKHIDFLEKPFVIDDLIAKVVARVGPPPDAD